MADVEAQTTKCNGEESPAAIFKHSNRPVTLKFENVVYKVKLEKEGMFRSSSKTEEKTILKGVTGIVKPGEMLAMLGPSGSGKTTLLTALGGRLGGGLEGSITYNGEAFTNKMKRNTGFVTQDDVLYEHLTVTETLVYTALLRLPNTLSKEEKIQHAEAVVSQLGLTRCKNSIIGGPFLRGVSGGERKRVSIGQEMLINPGLLFLDEPTSGLDSTTAQRIVSLLSDLAKGGKSIVMTIHQPSSRIFYLFNKVLLLSEGNAMYFGNGDYVMEYFSSIGFAPSVAMNPSDFLLDLANGVSPDDSMDDQSAVKEKLVSTYKEKLAPNVKEECIEYTNDLSREKSTDISPENKSTVIDKWPINWCQQFSILLTRGLKERRHEAFDLLKIGQVLVVAFLAGFLWWKSKLIHVQDQVGLLFFYSTFWGFFPLFQAIFTFPQERMMLSKERTSGMYRLSSYFMARTVSDMPMELILPTVFVIIVYWMAGLKPDAGSFFYNLFVLLLNVLVSQGLGLALGAFCLDQKKATTFGSVIMLAFMLAGGYYVQNVPLFISWIKYLSISQYTYKLLLGSQYGYNDTYPCNEGSSSSSCFIRDVPAVKTVGLDGQLVAFLAMLAMFVGYRLLAYIALMRIGRTPS